MKVIKFILGILLLSSTQGFCNETVVGTWKLVKMERLTEKETWEPRCINPTGLIIYSEQGYMAVGINCMKSPDSKEPTSNPMDMIFYAGSYSIRDQKIVHHVNNSASLDFFGKDLERTFSFDSDNLLTLTGTGKNGKTVRLVWKRVEYQK